MLYENITRVIHKGETKVCQFGLYDGFPTICGMHIAKFIRNTPDDEMRGYLDNVILLDYQHLPLEHQVNLDRRLTMTGAPQFQKMSEIERRFGTLRRQAGVPRYTTIYDETLMAVRKQLIEAIGAPLVTRYEAASTETGFNILDVVAAEHGNVTLWTDSYILSLTSSTSFVPCVWNVNYDTLTLEASFRRDGRVWTFEMLRSLTDDELETEMLRFERRE